MFDLLINGDNKIYLDGQHQLDILTTRVREITIKYFGLKENDFPDVHFYRDCLLYTLSSFGLFIADPIIKSPTDKYQMLRKLGVIPYYIEPYRMSRLNCDHCLAYASATLAELTCEHKRLFYTNGDFDLDHFGRVNVEFMKVVVAILDVVSKQLFDVPFVESSAELKDFPRLQEAYIGYTAIRSLDLKIRVEDI